MHDAQLHVGLRIGRVNRLGKAGQAVDAGHEDVSQSAVLQIRQAGQPELGSLALAQPQPQQLLVPCEIHAQSHVNRVLRDAAVRTPHMHDDAVEVHDRPDRVERPRSPGGHLRVEIGRDFRNQRGRDLHAVQLTARSLECRAWSSPWRRGPGSFRRSPAPVAGACRSIAARTCRPDRAA